MTGSVRPVIPADVPTVTQLIRELAAYERSEHAVEVIEAQLHDALFGPSPALFGHVGLTPDGNVVGFALWFLNFSTWRGTHGIYLEDLYVRPEHRGSGLGRQLLGELARVCVRRGYRRLEWSVLDWNAPAIGFYRAAGAESVDGWTVYRLTGDALERFATPPTERASGPTY
ncbi:MAG TPA: GNAT family N-acetyltransferase [Mycobacteriales bacterium]|nr:GNAT family N-acetyltransferase [Mycobacteriales bacterium]